MDCESTMVRANPFPGMNPFLEQRWRDFHMRYVVGLGDVLNVMLPDDLIARIEVVAYETVRVHHIEIRESSGRNEVITAIELLSPTNKLDPRGRAQYERKRGEYLAAGVNVMEIDLLRGGRHLLCVPVDQLPIEAQKTYKVCVVRSRGKAVAEMSGDSKVDCELYAAGLTEALPAISVPLRTTDRDVPLDLQSVLNDCFHSGKYVDLRYDRELNPPLSEVERQTVERFITGL
jgi:hypothetical protein